MSLYIKLASVISSANNTLLLVSIFFDSIGSIFFDKKYSDLRFFFFFLGVYLVQCISQYLGFHCEMSTLPSTSGLGCITQPNPPPIPERALVGWGWA